MALKVSSCIETRVVMALDRNEVQKLKEAGSPEQFQLFANRQQSAQKLLNSFDKTKPLTVNGYVVFQFYP